MKTRKEVNTMNTQDKEFLVQKIRIQYTEKEYSRLDELRALDKKVKKPANLFAYIFGSIGAIIMGCGMSLVMTELPAMIGLANGMIPGIAIGACGLVMALIDYPIYKSILSSRRKRYAAKIIELSNDIVNG